MDAHGVAEVDRIRDGVKSGAVRLEDFGKLVGAVADDEIRALVARAADVAEDAGIPADPEPVNLAEALRRIVDETFGSKIEDTATEPL